VLEHVNTRDLDRENTQLQLVGDPDYTLCIGDCEAIFLRW
jgi:hypothetical protein